MSFKDQINKFVGKVRISDIENAFNFIIENVNAFIDTINNGSEFLEDTDNFYLGSTSIPANNYTLTLGALKKILTAYDKEVIGGTVVKNPLNTSEAIVFPLLSIDSSKGISQVAQTVINKPTQQEISAKPDIGKGVYINPSTNVITDDNILAAGFYRSSIATVDDFTTMEYGDIEYSSQFKRVINVSYSYYSENSSYNAYIGTESNNWITPSLISVQRLGFNPLRRVDINIIYKDTSNVTHNEWIRLYEDSVEAPDNFNVLTDHDAHINIECDDTIYLQSIMVTSFNEFEEQTGMRVDISMDGYLYNYNTGSTPQVDPNLVSVADIDWNRDEWVMNTTADWLHINPDVSPLIKLTVQNPARGTAVNPDNSRPQFIVPRRIGTYQGEFGDYNGGLVRLSNGANIIDNNRVNYSHSRNRAIDFVFAPVWVPQGMASTIFPVYGCSIAQYYTLSQS